MVDIATDGSDNVNFSHVYTINELRKYCIRDVELLKKMEIKTLQNKKE